MANRPKSDRLTRDRAVALLLESLERNGSLSSQDYRAAVEVSGYSARQLKRRVEAAQEGPEYGADGAFEVDEDVITAVFLKCGNRAGAYRLLRRAGARLPSLSTFKRHVLREMGTDQLAYAKKGSRALRARQVWLTRGDEPRGHTLELDHTELPIYMVPRRYRHAIKPMFTAALCRGSRYPLAWVLTIGTPSTDEVRAVLMQAIHLRLAPDGVTWVGGRPVRVVWDRGLEFLSDAITECCIRLDIIPVPLPAYYPQGKGRLERWWGTLKRDALPQLPGYTDGPYDLRNRTSLATAALPEEDLVQAIEEWIDWYITEHRHQTTGLTPLEAWRQDGTPLDVIEPDRLWRDFMVSKDRVKVSKVGVRFETVDYIAPELTGVVGRHVEVRHLPRDRSFIEIFIDGEHLCTAEPARTLSDEGAEAVLRYRRERQRAAMARHTVANRERKTHDHALPIKRDEKTGVHHVVTDDVDLLEGPVPLLEELVASAPDAESLF